MAEPSPITGKDGRLAAFNPKSGEVERLTPEELTKGFLGGTHTLFSDQSYPMLDQDGVTHLVSAKDVQTALKMGGTFGTQLDVIRQEQRGPAGAFRAFADGVANRAAFGFGDALQVASGVDPDEIQARKDEHSTARTAGEVAGAVGGAAALGALAPGGLAAGALTEGTAATAAPSIATSIGGSALEGAVHGVGDVVSEAALGRTDVTAENLIAHGGLGFALGGVLGGALKIPAVRMIRNADRAAVVEGATGSAPESLADAWASMKAAYRNEGQGALRPNPLKTRDVGMPLPAAEPPGAKTVLEGLAASDVKGASKELKAFDRKAAADLKAFDRAQAKLEPAMTPAAQAEREQARSAFLEGQAAKRAKLEPLDYARPEPTPFETAPTEFATPMPVDEGATQVGRKVRPRAAAAPEEPLGSPGPLPEGGFTDEAFGGGSHMPASGGGGGGGLGSRGLGYMAGRMVGRAVGLGELGGFVGEQVMGSNPMRLAALARAGNVVKDYIADRMGAFAEGAARASEAAGLPRAVAPATLAILDASNGQERRDAMAKRIEELSTYGDDAATAQRATQGTAHFTDVAPDAASAIATKTVQIANYLKHAAPQPLATGSRLAPKNSYSLVSDRDVHRFAELDAALQDPLRIVDQLARGSVPPPEVMMAVRENYPRLFDQIQAAFAQHVAKHPDQVSWETTLKAGVAFGLATHPALDPQNLNTQQAAISAPPPGAPQPRRTGRSPAPPPPRGRVLAEPSQAESSGV